MPLRFECLFCDNCCIFEEKNEMPLVFYWEKEQLEEIARQRNINLRFEDFLIIDDGREKFTYIYRWLIDGRCPFFNRENKCDIHNDKPLTCRMYPLILEIPSLKIHLSGKCDWVKNNIREITPNDLPKIFENEFRIAIRVAAMLNEFFEEARKNGWKIAVNNG